MCQCIFKLYLIYIPAIGHVDWLQSNAENAKIDVQGLLEINLSASQMCIRDCFWTILCWPHLNSKMQNQNCYKNIACWQNLFLKGYLYFLQFWPGCKLCLNSCLNSIWSDSISHFYTPVWETDVLCLGNVRPSVRLLRTFLQHALRYQFETWYIQSVVGTTSRVWVASQLGYLDLDYSQK